MRILFLNEMREAYIYLSILYIYIFSLYTNINNKITINKDNNDNNNNNNVNDNNNKYINKIYWNLTIFIIIILTQKLKRFDKEMPQKWDFQQ